MKKELVPDSLLEALKLFSPTMVQASRTVIAEEVTKYPIFIASRDLFNAGVPIIVGEEYQREWNINISSLEEFFVKKFVDQAGVDQFRKVYKDPNAFFCVYLVEDASVRMLFLPIAGEFMV